jgi:exopolysaccharide production protein ExoQ
MHSFEMGQARSSTPMIDKCAIVPISAGIFASIVSPLIYFFTGYGDTLETIMETRQENRIFWPSMAAISLVLVVQNRSRFGRLPPHIICLLAYLAFAGTSVLWAFRPELSLIRFVQQVMILTSIVLPAMLAVRTADMMRALFLCFAFGSILNVFFVFGSPPHFGKYASAGYQGYFLGKNLLGQFAAIALLLALHEMLYPGFRRALGIIVVVVASLLLYLSNSKTALGFAFLAPLLAGVTLIIAKTMRTSPAIVVLSIMGFCVFSCVVTATSIYDLSQLLFNDRTLTGRTFIWDFALYEIRRSPLLGWGYQSFWLVGSDAPSIVDAIGWVKSMPEAHNGYLDTMLEMGFVGLALLVIFLIATLHAVGRVADRDPARAWLMLALILFAILNNFLESSWMRAFDLVWVVFAIVVAELGRCWQLFPPTRAAYGSMTPRRGSAGPSRSAQRPVGRIL